ncbi:unnamed protein product [Heligmosomoides polygyrus]|uniref:Dynein_AAA_lid domain-containing protein n=1 Tax=Heligmosomoides polygyrus TaxID=6339 RepID=A0A183GJK6_HELPZ|nr:unnamed protein product [Heligmosomoides polygyrus]
MDSTPRRSLPVSAIKRKHVEFVSPYGQDKIAKLLDRAGEEIPTYAKVMMECLLETMKQMSDTHQWDHENLVSEVLAGKVLELMTIPPGATSLCQPLDVYFFRLFERIVRRIHEHVLHFRPDFNCFSRDNTLKVVSQTYRQFGAPVFRRCFAYAWVSAGYVDTHPGHFSTPADCAFDEVPVDTHGFATAVYSATDTHITEHLLGLPKAQHLLNYGNGTTADQRIFTL